MRTGQKIALKPAQGQNMVAALAVELKPAGSFKETISVQNRSDDFVSFGQEDTFIGLIGPIVYRVVGKRTETRLVLERRHVSPSGYAHGGLLMTVMDITLGSTAGAFVGFDGVYPTVQLSCSFLAGAALGEELRGEAAVERMTRTLAFVTGRLTVDERTIMTASAIFRNPPAIGPKN